MSQSEDPVDINRLRETGPISSARAIFDELVGVDSADLTLEEIDRFLPDVHILRSTQLPKREFIKTHDALTKNAVGRFILPLEATFKVIYLIRNPLDICVSYAYHSGHTDFDRTIRHMANPKMALARSYKAQNNQLHQYMTTWHGHVESWEQMPSEKLLVVRYEDMKLESQETFSHMVRFAELDYDEDQITIALDKCRIERLQEQEEEKGFGEKMQRAKQFFRKGVVGSWREELTREQEERLINNHREMMMRYGYLDEDGNLLV